MNLKWKIDQQGGIITFDGVIGMHEIAKLRLAPHERACLNGTVDSASDFLLIAEMLFRRYEEDCTKSAPSDQKPVENQ